MKPPQLRPNASALRRRIQMTIFVHALRVEARRQHGRRGAYDYLYGLQERMLASGQDFHVIPGHAIIAKAVRVERRRRRFGL